MIDLEEFLKKNIHMLPDLPMIKFKKDHVEYEVTNIRYLNNNAINVFQAIISSIKANPECAEWTFAIPEEYDDDYVHIIMDIIMGLTVNARKRGKNGFTVSSKLLECSAHVHKDDGNNRLLTFKANPNRVKTICECIDEENGVSMCNIAVSVINECLADLRFERT